MPEPWKTAPDHYFSSTKLYSWHYALGQVAFSWHSPNPDSFVGLPDGEMWFITPEKEFPLLQSPTAASFSPLQPALGIGHGDLRLVCGCTAIETHFMEQGRELWGDSQRNILEKENGCTSHLTNTKYCIKPLKKHSKHHIADSNILAIWSNLRNTPI